MDQRLNPLNNWLCLQYSVGSTSGFQTEVLRKRELEGEFLKKIFEFTCKYKGTLYFIIIAIVCFRFHLGSYTWLCSCHIPASAFGHYYIWGSRGGIQVSCKQGNCPLYWLQSLQT